MFELRHVSKRYGRTVALDALDLSIATGRTTALIGPSGAGKSSVLRMLVGLEWPDSGEVRFDGQPLRRETLLEQRRRIGYVIQEGGLFPHLTGAGNAALLDEPLGALDPIVRHELQAQMRELFDALDKTVVLVTHDVAEAAWLGDTLVLLRDGRVLQQGSARDLLEAPAVPFVREFMTAQRSVGDRA